MNCSNHKTNLHELEKTISASDELILIEDNIVNKLEHKNKIDYDISDSTSNPSFDNENLVEKLESPSTNLSLFNKHFNHISKNSNTTIIKDMVINEKETKCKEYVKNAIKLKLQANQAFNDKRYEESLNLYYKVHIVSNILVL